MMHNLKIKKNNNKKMLSVVYSSTWTTKKKLIYKPQKHEHKAKVKTTLEIINHNLTWCLKTILSLYVLEIFYTNNFLIDFF